MEGEADSWDLGVGMQIGLSSLSSLNICGII